MIKTGSLQGDLGLADPTKALHGGSLAVVVENAWRDPLENLAQGCVSRPTKSSLRPNWTIKGRFHWASPRDELCNLGKTSHDCSYKPRFKTYCWVYQNSHNEQSQPSKSVARVGARSLVPVLFAFRGLVNLTNSVIRTAPTDQLTKFNNWQNVLLEKTLYSIPYPESTVPYPQKSGG